MSIGNEDSFSLPEKLFEQGTEPTLQLYINYHSNLNLFGGKWDKYFEKELDYIKRSPFGSFYRLAKENEFIWSGTLVHFLLANQLVTKKKYELWSLFGGQPIRFSLDEFQYITGLSCDHYPIDNAEDDEDENSRWTRMLNLKSYPSLQDLEEIMLTCSEWTREDRIRLAYLLILAGILFARKRTCPLPRKYIELIRNIDKFERYPWGRAAFEFLICSVHEVKDYLCNPSYVINGFIQVLQIWGYEAIPVIAKKMKAHVDAKRAPDDCIMLKWKGSRARIKLNGLIENTKKVDVHPFIGNGDTQTLLSSRWTDEIQDLLVNNLVGSILSNNNFEKEFWVGHGLNVGPSNQMRERPSVRAKKRKTSKVEDEEDLVETEKLITRLYFDSCIEKVQKSISSGYERLITKIERMDTRIEGIDKNISELTEQVKIMQQKDTDSGKKPTLSTDSTTYSSRKTAEEEEKQYEDVESESTFPLLGDFKTNSVTSLSPTSSIKKSFKTRKLQILDAQMKEVTSALRAKLEKSNKKYGDKLLQQCVSVPRTKKIHIKSRFYYDPFGPIDEAKIAALNEWNKIESNEVQIGLYKVKNDYWETLSTGKRWLNDGHIDACLSMFNRRVQKTESPFRSKRMSFLYTYFSYLVSKVYPEFLEKKNDYRIWGKQLIDYCNGDGITLGYVQPEGKFLVDVDELYTVVNIDKTHWIALAISLVRRQVDIYDSLISYTSEEAIMEKIAPFANIIPHLIKQLSGNKKLKDTKYKIRRMKSIPQNYQSGDCGVYAIKYIECLALGADMKSELSDKNIGRIRKKLAAEIFDETCNI